MWYKYLCKLAEEQSCLWDLKDADYLKHKLFDIICFFILS